MPKGKALRMPSSAGSVSRSRVTPAAAVPPTTAPVATPPAVIGSPVVPAVADPQLRRNYEQLLDTVVKGYRNSVTSQIEFYHDMGVAANSLAGDAARNTYGDATVDQFADDLKTRTGRELGRSSVYSAMRVASTFNKDDVATLVLGNWSLRNVLFLTAEAVSDKLRKEIIREVASKELNQKDVQKRLEKEVKPKATRGRKISKPAPELKRFVSSASKFLDRFANFDKVLSLLPKVKDDGEKKVLKVAMGDTLKGMKNLHKELGNRIAAAQKIKFD